MRSACRVVFAGATRPGSPVPRDDGVPAGPPAIRGHPLKRARRLGMGVDVAEAVAAGDGFLHRALLYRGAAELRGARGACAAAGRAEPVLIAPAGKVSWLRANERGDRGVAFTDMTELAATRPDHPASARYGPYRAADPWVGEPVWPERSARGARGHAYEAWSTRRSPGPHMVCLYDRRDSPRRSGRRGLHHACRTGGGGRARLLGRAGCRRLETAGGPPAARKASATA